MAAVANMAEIMLKILMELSQGGATGRPLYKSCDLPFLAGLERLGRN